jgi:hypothetical protein
MRGAAPLREVLWLICSQIAVREGGRHTVYVNRAAQRSTSIPRHREINDLLARKICRDLQVPEPNAT